MNIAEAIAGRRSVREYTGESVDRRTIESLIEAAIKAPNAVNQQPWTFTVVRDQALLGRISDAAKAHMLAGPLAGRFREHLADPKFHIFYHAPVLVLICAAKQAPWIVEDCAMAAENLMLSAYAAGLGTCWIGFAQSYLNTPEGRAMLGLADGAVAIAPIILGHPKAAAPAVPRNKPEIRWVG